ncbi:hypothetical protein MNBD_ALPHA08-1562 [hydrothermal vent metagenome]|uniref:Magnesium transporter MgtE intracellular domain-containing protein n=1 Tax=hydrothermal vent metagenome TaxID=652676 RepID=A0A3B0RJV8_9ZZZZ
MIQQHLHKLGAADFKTVWLFTFVLATLVLAGNTLAQEKKPRMAKAVSPEFAEDFQKYCFNNSDAVNDAKFSWQAKRITDMEAELKTVIARLEVKQKEYKTWVTRREEFISKMTTSLVKIYSTMEPEAAAAQIAIVDYDTAVSILTKLKPRAASAILNEMDPLRASQLVKVIVGSVSTEQKETN